MKTMCRLPNEIWTIILNPFLPDNSEDLDRVKQQTLANCCLVSKDLCAAAQPLLCNYFVKPGPPSQQNQLNRLSAAAANGTSGSGTKDDGSCLYRATSRLELFLSTLIKRPELAHWVEHLKIEEFFDDAESRDINVRTVPPDHALSEFFGDAVRKIKHASSFQTVFWDILEGNLRQGLESAQVALLLALTPNLRSLHLEHSAANGPDLGKDVQGLLDQCFSSQSSDSLQLFSRLERFNVREPTIPIESYEDEEGEPEEVRIHFRHVADFLALPTLKSFSVYGMKEFSEWEKPLPGLRHLRIENCAVQPTQLHSLMEACPNLVSLQIVFSRVFPVDVSDRFSDALDKMAGTLERLSLYAFGLCVYPITSRPFDLRGFEKLKCLELDEDLISIPQSYLSRDWMLFPPRLECFSMRNISGASFVDDDDLMSNFIHKFPSIKHIGFGVHWNESGEAWAGIEMLEERSDGETEYGSDEDFEGKSDDDFKNPVNKAFQDRMYQFMEPQPPNEYCNGHGGYFSYI